MWLWLLSAYEETATHWTFPWPTCNDPLLYSSLQLHYVVALCAPHDDASVLADRLEKIAKSTLDDRSVFSSFLYHDAVAARSENTAELLRPVSCGSGKHTQGI